MNGVFGISFGLRFSRIDHQSEKLLKMKKQTLSQTFLPGGIFFIDGFISEKECDRILEELEFTYWYPSLTYREQEDGSRRNIVTEFRVSETADQEWFSHELQLILQDIENRLHTLFDVKIANLEHWQATNYPLKGKLDYHLDAGYWDNHPAGDRGLTFLLYLNSTLKGGETHFRALDVKVEAKAGRLLVWDNLFPTGDCSHKMIHSGLPILEGNKTTLVTWQRQRKFRMQETPASKEK